MNKIITRSLLIVGALFYGFWVAKGVNILSHVPAHWSMLNKVILHGVSITLIALLGIALLGLFVFFWDGE
jgi:hypothetical protein